MKSESSFIKNGLTMTLSVVAGGLFVTMAVKARTTTSTNIATDGRLLLNNATSTITNLSMITSTTTNATTTSLGVTGLAQFTGGILANSSTSTITSLVMVDATSTSLYASGRAAFNSIFSVAATSSLATTTVNRFLVVGSTTPQHNTADVLIDGAATTTLQISTSLITAGGCIQMKSPTGANTRVYVGGAGTNLVVEAGLCK